MALDVFRSRMARGDHVQQSSEAPRLQLAVAYQADCVVSYNRGGLEELSSRINKLEAAVFAQDTRGDAPEITNSHKPVDMLGDMQNSRSFSSSSGSSVARSYRGTISPWSILVNHLQTANIDPELELLRVDASRLADDERSSITTADILYDLNRSFPHLTKEDIMNHIKAYARDAPYPILHYESLLQTTSDLLELRSARHWGQLVCVLMVRTSSLPSQT